MARRIKSIFDGEEVSKVIGKKNLALLSISLFLLILTISAIRVVNPAVAGQSSYLSRVDRFQRCENYAGTGFFWVDTVSGNIWWADPGNSKWVYSGQPEGAEPGRIGTYMPCANKAGAGLFILDTRTGNAWWARGYEEEWNALVLGRPEKAETGETETYACLEKEASDPPKDYGGFYILNTRTGSGWWTPPSNKDNWYPTMTLSNPDAEPGEIGTYMPCKDDSNSGLFAINTAAGQVWWTNGYSWNRLDKGEAKGGRIGTYMPYDNKDGAGIHILSHRTGEGWWTNGDMWVSLDEAAGEDYAPSILR